MSTTRTAAESRADYEQIMGQDLGAIYAELVQELSQIHLVWDQYKILFGTKKSRVDLLNEAAGSFFRIVQDSIFDQVLLAISRLTDRPTVAGHQTLTVRRLADIIPDTTVANAVRAKVDLAVKAEEFCRDWRNNRIGHNNLDQRINPSARPLQDATRIKVDAALNALADVLNLVAAHYLDSETAYDRVLLSLPDAEALLYVLHDGLAAQSKRREKMEAGEFSSRDYPSDL
ncbi:MULTISPECIES: AbiU2 domain-containing protein [unclassified Mesorhizobium]|uniref:AbiU2 domain-containing protein n=1 Tax=unclassified Mesorhizobium TaxID=325217 RepID=UPI000F7551EC|nr:MULTISPECIES: hypothetical protein [unclassified Mesorhizobium]AZO68939.1 hypothetical protein EJ075_31190 [Mesorhizobium sp. M6A.T.Cr.TU.016.01.1.1]RWP45418.1 MAG: hypothetical protein EOR06_31325 [Mesorhizobium sp.]RWQ69289.1 MAG: hypothetical protein EOS85_29570 [Mesorhizobium sp.]